MSRYTQFLACFLLLALVIFEVAGAKDVNPKAPIQKRTAQVEEFEEESEESEEDREQFKRTVAEEQADEVAATVARIQAKRKAMEEKGESAAPANSAAGVGPSEAEDEANEEPNERVVRENGEMEGDGELIPSASYRISRGNGVGISVLDVDGEANLENEIVVEDAIVEENRNIRHEDECALNKKQCSENSQCCSGFCSWTRGFICHGITG